MNMIETMPAAPFVCAASASCVTPSTTVYALNVPATMSANAAMTMPQKSQQKRRNSFLPSFPMYFSISMPMDLPSFLTEA